MKIWNEILLIDKLRKEHKLTAEEYKILLECQDSNCLSYLQKQAQEEALSRFGNRVFIRGLIEVTNRCRNNCYYCGIRKGNPSVSRYGLTRETILACCREGYEAGFRTFVMQGGEDPAMTDEWTEQTVASIHRLFPDCAITLSLGEKTRETYERFFHAGANRYLLRHETYNKEDLLFIERFQPEMIGIGPFIPHHDTPFAGKAAGSMEMTLKLLSIFRLMHPYALIPSTTALATLASDGRERGILAGANVVMPNLSPPEQRTKYTLYDNKAAFGAEAAEGLKKLSERLNAIGYRISTERGDYNGNRT